MRLHLSLSLLALSNTAFASLMTITGSDGSSQDVDFADKSFFDTFTPGVSYTIVTNVDIAANITAVGADGGTSYRSGYNRGGGLGGTSTGIITFLRNEEYQLTVGTAGRNNNAGGGGGFPGGGSGTSSGGGGGGYTGLFYNTPAIIAGAGGGGGNDPGFGGFGGGLSGGSGTGYTSSRYGRGGTQTTGGAGGGSGSSGDYLQGGAGGAGGGGGYYGGGGGNRGSAVAGGGGGGSGYINLDLITDGSTTEGSGTAPVGGSSSGSFSINVISIASSGNGNGDPHFTTFAGTSFDYHGECDLVMLSNPSFASGSGLSVHIRTTRMDGRLLSYSYISGAAVGIGNNMLEVQEDGTLIMDGNRIVESHSGDGKQIDGSYPTEFATYSFIKNMTGKKKKITQYVLKLTDTIIDRAEGESSGSNIANKSITITIHSNPRTHMLFVKIDGDVHDSIGLLGEPLAGNRLLGRDGVTDMSYDWNEYGEEWQVRDMEPKLFQENRAPQYPDPCIYYASDGGHLKKTHNLRRRLLADGEGENSIVTMEAANNACAEYLGVKKENCVHDVMVMGDLEVAEDPSYNG